ncbi:intraflagellar transport protein 81 homolog [Sycon ciliatum]|uniref:intraflagellar transport protein 81 homolog n=1 Tax=Sycon ciliatum TaxID=27933 RepID=UPI0031F6FFFC
MSEDMKFIVENLNKKPFSKKFNLISFDALEPLQLLQVLNDVISEIDPQQKVDLRDEPPEDTAVRMFSILRLLKYKPPTDQGNLSAFRLGLVQGDKLVVHPILCYLLRNIDDLNTRMYLSRFLVKIDVPMDMLQDDTVQSTFSTYESLMKEFRDVHRAKEKIKSSGATAAEIRKDIANMEEERRQVKARLARQKKKVRDNVPNADAAIKAAQQQRGEKGKERELAMQKVDQKNQLLHTEQRYQRLRKQLRELQTANMGSSAEGLIQQLEEENAGNAFTVKEKLPKELEAAHQLREVLKKVVDEPVLTPDDFETLEAKLHQTNEVCQSLHEERLQQQRPGDDKLSLFRQQAAVVSRKKAAVAQTLAERREELGNLEGELAEKRAKFDGVGKDDLEPDGMNKLVSAVRRDHDEMRAQKRKLEALQAENGIKERTLDLLIEREQEIKQELVEVEEQYGITGYQKTQHKMEKVASRKSKIDEQKERVLEEMSALVIELNKVIEEKKATLTPLLADMRTLRQAFTATKTRYDEAKAKYDTTRSEVESELAPLEQEVRSLRQSDMQQSSRLLYLQATVEAMSVKLARAATELKLYQSGVKEQDAKQQTFREFHNKTMVHVEKQSKELKQTQKDVRTRHPENIKQMKMWQDLHALMGAKREAFKQQEEQRQKQVAQDQEMLANEDHLVL